jgi:hypothetical protein
MYRNRFDFKEYREERKHKLRRKGFSKMPDFERTGVVRETGSACPAVPGPGERTELCRIR